MTLKKQKDFSYLDEIINDGKSDSNSYNAEVKTSISTGANESGKSKFSYLDDIINGTDNSGFATTNEQLAASPISEDSIIKQAEKASGFMGTLEYLGKSAVSGATMGIFPNEMDTDSTPLKVAGAIANGITTLATGLLLPEVAIFGKGGQAVKAGIGLLKAEKTLAPLFGAGEAVVKGLGKEIVKETAKKAGMAIGNAAATGAVYSGAVEGIKSIRAGESTEDTLANILTGAGTGFIAGAAVGGLVEGASSFVGRKVEGKVSQALKTTFSEPGIRDLAEVQTSLINQNAKEYIAANADKFAKKIKEINPTLTPWELVARPEALKADLQERLAPLANDLFLKPNGAGSVLYKENESLKKLVDSGDYAGAISLYDATARTQIKGNDYLKDYIKEPFLLDSKVLPEVMADHLLSKKAYQGLKADRQKIVNYFSDPKSQTNVDELLLIKDPRAKKPTFSTVKGAKDLKHTVDGNIRLGSLEVDNLVSQRLTELYKTVADGKITDKNALLLGDYDSVLKTLTTFNKPLTRTVMESFVSGNSKDDVFGTIAQEDQELVQNLAFKRIDQQELVRIAKQRQGLLADLKLAKTPELQESINRDLKDNLRKMYRVQANVDASTTALNSSVTDPKQLERLNKIVDSMYLPKAEKLENKLTPEIRSQMDTEEGQKVARQAIKNALFSRDNPKFVKDFTDLSDILQAMDNAGYDIDLTNGYTGGVTSNVQRKIMKEFGHNNIIQTAVFDKIKQANVEKQSFFNDYMASLKKAVPDLKAGSRVEKLLPDFIENKFTVTDDAFTSLTAKEQQDLIKASDWTKATFDEVLGQVNEVLRRNNETLIMERNEYFPMYRDHISGFFEKMKMKFRGETDPTTYSGLTPERPDFSPKRKTASFEKRRSGLSLARGDARLGALQSIERYLKDASGIIYTTDLAKAVNAAADFAPTGMSRTLRSINEKYIMELPDKSLNTPLGKGVSEIRRRMANSLLIGTPSVAIQQMLSIPSSAAIGGKESLVAMWKRWTPELKTALSKSTNIALRDAKNEGYELGTGVIRPLLRKFGGKAGNITANAFTSYEKFTSGMLKLFDKEAASHAFTTGYIKATKQGLKGDDAIRYADYTAGLLQGEMTKIGQPEFMGNVYGRTLTQFMSYSMNMFATLKDDLPMIAKSDGAVKALQMIARTYVGMTLTNEILRDNGMPPQFDVQAYFPFHDGNRGMIPGAYGVLANFANTFSKARQGEFKDSKKDSILNWTGKTGTSYESTKALKKAESDVINLLGIPGLGQAQKTIRAMESKEFKKLKPAQKVKVQVFGKKALGLQSSKDRQKDFKNTPFRKKVKKVFFK